MPNDNVLKPCPFCGGDVKHIQGLPPLDDSHFIDCPGCGISSKIASTKEAVIEAWNRRAHPGQPEPIDMLLFCPKCGVQHVDAPEKASEGHPVLYADAWTNSPHRSHLCHACGTIWRPADVPTNGVAAIQTSGKADTWSGQPVLRAEVTDEPSLTNPLTPYGMLVRALRIVSGTTLMDMADALLTTPAKLSAMEFDREPVTPEFAFEVAAYFDAIGVLHTASALRAAAARTGGQ